MPLVPFMLLKIYISPYLVGTIIPIKALTLDVMDDISK